jgi:hypothetical protein
VILAVGVHGSYFRARTARIKSLLRRGFRPLELWLVVSNPETARQVSGSDPYYLDRRSCRSQWLSTQGEDSIGTGEGEGEPSEASEGTRRYHCDVSFLLTSTSCEGRLEGHHSWSSWHCLRRRSRGLGSIYSTQSPPGCPLRHL